MLAVGRKAILPQAAPRYTENPYWKRKVADLAMASMALRRERVSVCGREAGAGFTPGAPAAAAEVAAALLAGLEVRARACARSLPQPQHSRGR